MALKRNLSWIITLAATAIASGQPSPVTVQDLTCEFQTNPVAVQTTSPRLSWKLSSVDRSVSQSSYQVVAATQPELLTPDGADLWNTQQRNTSNTLQIPYEGKPLAPNQTAYWIVRIWDEKGTASQWSEPARFTAALQPADWKAQWIGTGAKPAGAEPIATAHWIWGSSAQDAADGITTEGKAQGGAIRQFRKTFNLDPATTALTIQSCADNEAEISLNGTLLKKSTEWERITYTNAMPAALPGQENQLTIRVKNTGTTPNSAGLIAAIVAHDGTTETLRLFTDSTWQVRRIDPAATTTESPWDSPVILGEWGVHPWHKITQGEQPVIPILRKEFSPGQPVKKALVHVSGLGQYVLHLNGSKVGDGFLDPAWSVYEKTLYYNTFDVTDAITSQSNALGIMLGKGFYNTLGDRRIHGVFADRPLALILQLDLLLQDGTTTSIITDSTWKWTPGPVTHNSILGGTDYDARLLPSGWDKPGFDASTWSAALPTPSAGGRLTAAAAPPMRKFQEFQPKSIEEPKPGHFVYDFGQNCSAAPRITVKGPAGSTIKLTWAEQRKGQDPFTNNGKGVVDQSGIGSGFITYTLRGGEEETCFSELFYTGYQYLELTGGVPAGQPNPDNLPVVSNITSVHVHSDQPAVGKFHTSNPMFNRIDTMIDWAVRSNFGHVFTDCPTREKLGWLEVPWLMWASVASRYDIAAYAEKITRDIRDSQLPDGQIETVAPSYPEFSGGFKYTAEWGAAGVFVPWYAYEWYNDSRTLDDNYHAMRAYVDYLTSTSTDLIAAPGLGDWYDYWPGEKLGASRFTPTELTATAVFAGCADIVSSSAQILNKPADAAKYARLAAKIRKAFNKKFRTAPGQYQNSGSPQTAHAMALVFDMVPADERTSCAQTIVDDLRTREWQQTSGDVGYRFLINALSQTGHSDVIFKILNRDKIGSYAYLVNSGWTSLPEAWNANPTSSMNHCMLGHIQEWFTQHLLGIAPAPGSVGFDTVAIQPTPGDGVTSASGSLATPRGPVDLKWELTGKQLQCDFTIPANTRGLVRLPVPAGSTIQDHDKPISEVPGISPRGRAGDREILEVGSGSYSITATAP